MSMKKVISEIFNPDKDQDKKSVDFLINAISANSLQGFDYLKFKESVHSLLGMGMDESTAIKSSFATISTLGISKDKLLETGNHYLDVLNKEKEQFDAALQKQMHQRVASKKDETLYLKEKLEEYSKKISELQSQIEDITKKIGTADSEIKAAKNKIEKTKDLFESTYNTFVKKLKTDLSFIQKQI